MKKTYLIFTLLLLSFSVLNAQDTLSGNYEDLVIVKGRHIISSMVIVSNSLKVDSGAKVEFIDNGTLVCGGLVEMIGNNRDILFYGKKNNEGVGLIINNSNEKSILINNVVFRNLQMPIYFDFGWKRSAVNIQDNYFINNKGKVTVIQVLNPPFNLSNEANAIDFILQHNLFAGNSASIYFEDLKSDHVKYDISNNTFYGNNIYGFKNYNISTNVLYGRADELYTRFAPIIENNSFAYNYLIDNITDTVVHAANFGIYGTDKSFPLKKNYLGSSVIEKIKKSIYDQTLNYNAPKIDFEPFLNQPNGVNPTHVYKVSNLDDTELVDTIIIKDALKGFTFSANNGLDFTKSTLNYIYFKDDSTLKRTDTLLTFDKQPNGNDYKCITWNAHLCTTQHDAGHRHVQHLIAK